MGNTTTPPSGVTRRPSFCAEELLGNTSMVTAKLILVTTRLRCPEFDKMHRTERPFHPWTFPQDSLTCRTRSPQPRLSYGAPAKKMAFLFRHLADGFAKGADSLFVHQRSWRLVVHEPHMVHQAKGTPGMLRRSDSGTSMERQTVRLLGVCHQRYPRGCSLLCIAQFGMRRGRKCG